MDVLGRRDLIKREARCFNCLNLSHGVYECRTKIRCHTCSRKHHTLLHYQPSNELFTISAHLSKSTGKELLSIDPQSSLLTNDSSENKSSTLLNVSAHKAPSASFCTLFPTALIKIKDSTGEWQLCRALLVSGSQTSLASETLIQRLHLPRTSARVTISGIGQTKAGTSRGKANLVISSRLNQTTLNIQYLIVPRLTSYQPASFINQDLWHHVKHLPLADPTFNQPRPIDLLIGSEHLLTTGRITEEGTGLVAQNTIFWYIIAGLFTTGNQISTTFGFHCEVDIDNLLRKFWELEEVTSPNQLSRFTEEEIACQEHFEKHTTRSDKGRIWKHNQRSIQKTTSGRKEI